MPYVEREITRESSPLAISLARHLHSIGAKLYGAFWCSHCVHQKEVILLSALKLFGLDTLLYYDFYYSPPRSQLKNGQKYEIKDILDIFLNSSWGNLAIC